MSTSIQAGPGQEAWQEINTWLNTLDDKPNMRTRLERNYVLSGYPDFWLNENLGGSKSVARRPAVDRRSATSRQAY